MKLGYRRKRRNMPIRNAILLRDNARPHTVALTREKLGKIHWKTLEYPPYSLDLSPRDSHMFGPLIEEQGGHHFDDDDGAETFVRNRLQTRPDSFFDIGFKKLTIRWEKCANKKEDYMEGEDVIKILFTVPICVLKQKCGFIFDSPS